MTTVIRLSVTDDYDALVPFFIENELEFSEEEPPVTEEIVKLWKITEDSFDEEGDPFDSRIIGGFVLAKRQGEFICDGIAVDPEYREHGLGHELVAAVENWARESGASGVRVNAADTMNDALTFYKSMGYNYIRTQYNFRKMFED